MGVTSEGAGPGADITASLSGLNETFFVRVRAEAFRFTAFSSFVVFVTTFTAVDAVTGLLVLVAAGLSAVAAGFDCKSFVLFVIGAEFAFLVLV